MKDWNEITHVSALLAIICAVFAGVSRRMGDLILGMISVIVQLVSQSYGNQTDGNQTDDRFSSHIPKTLVTVLSRFNLDGQVTVYAVCPQCHCTFAPQKVLGSTKYQAQCNNEPRPGSGICGASLLDPSSKPIKTFVYHHFNDYLASLLSRPDIEKIMDARCDSMKESTTTSMAHGHTSDPFPVKDILAAKYMRTFKGPSGSTLFVDRPDGEGRYGFVLNVDFYNPEGNRGRSAKASCGIVAMACINLPLSIRYRPENMYLAGIIPGPHEPSLTTINHYLRPLITDMVSSWTKGTIFTRTASSLNGRMTRSAIIAVVCDLPAARKVSQLAGHKSQFCSRCTCYHLSELDRVDQENWQCRDAAGMRRQAYEWKNALSTKEQDNIFKNHGVRWSVLWELPYWDPTCQLIVDPMHSLFEGVINHHVEVVLSISSMTASAKSPPAFSYEFTQYEKSSTLSLNENEVRQIKQIHKLLTLPINDPEIDGDGDVEMTVGADDIGFDTHGLRQKLRKRVMSALEFVAKSLDVYPSRGSGEREIKKNDVVEALINWVSTK